jgi:hypothetical protein
MTFGGITKSHKADRRSIPGAELNAKVIPPWRMMLSTNGRIEFLSRQVDVKHDRRKVRC